MRRMLATEVVGGLSQTAMGAILALVPASVTAFRPCSGAAPPCSGRFSRRDAAVRAVLCVGADCGDPQASAPGFWAVLQENGPDFDALPGFWAVISVPRRDSCRWLRYSPRSEAFTSSVPRSAAYETAQNLAWALCRISDRAKNGVMDLRNRPELHSGVRSPSAG